MSKNINNKKELAEKLKKCLNSPGYVAVSDLIKSGDYGPDLVYDGEKDIFQRREIVSLGKGPGLIYYNDLETADWEEIIKLIEKRNQERERNYQAKKKKIEDKVDSQPGLYYYYGGQSRNWPLSSFDYGDKKGYYFGVQGSENGRSFHLNINNNHPVLDTFPYENGFYLIETDKKIERNDGVVRPWSDGGENNPSNFHKWVEVGDQITITPYEVENNGKISESQKKELDSETARKGGCDTCQKKLKGAWFKEGDDNFYIIKRYQGKVGGWGSVIWVCRDCYSTKEAEYLQNCAGIYERFKEENGEIDYRLIKAEWIDCYAGNKDQNGQILKQRDCSHCQPWKQHQISNPNNGEVIKQIAAFLLHYFQEHNIKEIKLINNELIITHNNNEIISAKDNHEFQNVENYLLQNNKKTLNLEEVKELLNNSSSPSNSTPDSSKKNYTPYLVGGAAGLGLAALIAFGYCLRKKNKNN